MLRVKKEEMMYCKYCGTQIGDHSLFCSKCGQQVIRTANVRQNTYGNAMQTQQNAYGNPVQAQQNPYGNPAQFQQNPNMQIDEVKEKAKEFA